MEILERPWQSSSATLMYHISISKYLYLSLTKMVFGFENCSDLLWEKNCSSDREKLLKFEAEGREFSIFQLVPESFSDIIN